MRVVGSNRPSKGGGGVRKEREWEGKKRKEEKKFERGRGMDKTAWSMRKKGGTKEGEKERGRKDRICENVLREVRPRSFLLPKSKFSVELFVEQSGNAKDGGRWVERPVRESVQRNLPGVRYPTRRREDSSSSSQDVAPMHLEKMSLDPRPN